MTELTASGATAAARATFDKTLNVIVDVFVPVGAALGGFFLPSLLGGGMSVANLVYKAEGNPSSGASAQRVAWGVQGLINAAVGGAFWGMRNAGGIVLKAIGGGVGGFFLGGALGCVPGVITATPSAPPAGLLDKVATWMQNVAKGG